MAVVTEYIGVKAVTATQQDYSWYTQPKEAQYQNIFSVVNRIDQQQSYRRTMNLRNARLYSNLEVLGMAIYNTGVASGVPQAELDPNRVTYNLVKSCVDTAASKIAKNRPKPMFLTSKGDYAQQERAENLSQYVEGVFYDINMYSLSAKAFIDGCIFGTGAVKFFVQDDKINAERVLIEELKVDDNDALYGKPKSMYQVKQVTRSALAAQYPEFAIKISQASSSTPASSNIELIKVIEAWHLGPNGKHTIAIENATIFNEDYTSTYFPFVFYRWSERLTGFFGQGLAEELCGLQLEVNRTLQNISYAQKLVAQPRVAIESNAKISVSQLTNEPGSILRYQSGAKPPMFFTPTAMNPEVYNHLKWLIQSGYEKTGISQMSATSKKPSGLDSGAALREYNDIESERFMLTGLQFEQLHLDAADIIVDMSKQLYENGVNLETKIPSDGFIQSIKWSEVNLEKDKFVMKVFPTSLLPTNPSTRIQKVEEMIQAGWIDKDDALDLLDFPDLKAYQSLETANNKLIEKTIYEMLKTGHYYPPEPQMKLDVAMSQAHKHYLLGRVNELPEDRLELLLRFMDDVERLQNLTKAPAEMAPLPTGMAPPDAMAPAPLGVPEALPQSELLPQIPV